MNDRAQSAMNRIWSQVLLEELTRLGVGEVCIAPGSRSTPLVIEACDNPKLTLHTHFDERGLAFMAHGLAKASKRPVAIIVTSGTAVANLLPAIVEANITGEKLVVITADRPVELINCGVNQAINQASIFSSHARHAINLPSPSESVPLNWLLTSVDQLMYKQETDGGVIHINCPFPEPLYESSPKSVHQTYMDRVAMWWKSGHPFSCKSVSHSSLFAQDLGLFAKKGVILVGDVSLEEAKLAKKLAKVIGWPCLCDPQSGVSSSQAYYDVWLLGAKDKELISQAEVILQFGARFVSKRLFQWVEIQVKEKQAQYHYVSVQAERNNPSHVAQVHHVSEICSWIDSYLSRLGHSPVIESWCEELYLCCLKVRSLIDTYVLPDEAPTEIGLATTLESLPADTQIVLGNSLFVRLVDMFGVIPNTRVYSNRGASGIDGLVATTAGVVRSTNRPCILYLGDTSALHDLNSLALFTDTKTPVVLVVINNDGGAIFDLLPVSKAHKRQLYQMPHGYQFEYAAKQFGLKYQQPNSLADYNYVVKQHLTNGEGILMVEVITPPEQASKQLKELVGYFDAC
ncbi:2-succinyl-5-enolpyruvyl-6-hydroxy-3-cyclohexene-1-carboxylic-acid synthase [Vibrio sp. OCN044]|uniref:2-succinyl-5-enolpyruvyl-6-hydroxy-3-cyclohexene-1-carboxylate synthase n=1 Tax=Vibrio tetraodonis subsp. pristinus TaxID=2695891 RepID=A0A6L8LZ95_9VIBR|nr:2-succinyl-5-enolpyruvyl-6-hydroxy-3-cyclohexene-1-carboxylic-acid synthase [Vibrio tetraodonis]MYM59970.1 2-succinyl-5-enolpyruvyl-6-hydroxy-3-cyclohexene-1-carboxylic-acid synthase [Vibrio tetraodonis subsp. pristinus]